ncbi:MAG: signal peptidase II [Actinomycetota bacterium]
MKPVLVLTSTAAVALAADQATKAVALAALEDGRTTPVIDGVLHWTLQRNPGAAFGIFQRAPVLFTVLAIAIVVFIVAIAPRTRDILNAVALGLVLGGALGNLTDRLFRPPGPFRGRVIDFIDFRVWPTFNVADIAVVVGAGLLAIASFRADRLTRPAQ